MLTGAQPRQEDGPAVRKLQRVVMSMRLLGIDLPEARYTVSKLAQPQPGQHAAQHMFVLELVIEHYLGTGKQADRHVWLANGRKAAGDGAGKAACDHFFANRGRTRRDAMQAIVTHGGHSTFLRSPTHQLAISLLVRRSLLEMVKRARIGAAPRPAGGQLPVRSWSGL